MKRKRMRKRMSQRAVSFLCILTLFITMMPATAFAGQTSDISNHWAKAQINSLLEKGYITGYQDGTFKPDKNITRAEFMAIINRAFQFTEKSDSSFTDVRAGAWYADVVNQAKAAGYIGGYPDGSIRPDNTITRQEAASIITKLKKLAEDTPAAGDFKDASKLAGWSKAYIGAAAASGLMNGYPDGSFRAANNITRAEAAVVLDKALLFEACSAAGAYGPESGIKTVRGNVGVYADGVTLQNMVIEGDLLLAASIGEGTVTLKNVTVKGTTNVKGGGEHSILVIDSTLGTVKVFKENGKIRIVVSGNTTVGLVTAASGVKLEESGLTDGAAGFREIVIDASKDDIISLVGTFDKVTLDTAGVTINVPSGTTVNTMVLNRAASVTGTGTIQAAQVNASGTTFEKQPVTQTGPGAVQQSATPSSGGSRGNGSSGSPEIADMVLHNGYVYSVNGTSQNAPVTIASAVAIKAGRILYVGSESGVQSHIKEGTTTVIDLEGKMVLPGFADSHAHAKAMAANMTDVSLYGTKTPAQVIAAVRAWTEEPGNAGFTQIMGNGWDTLTEADMIASGDVLNDELGAIAPGVPIVLYDSSHHIAWANSVAMEKAKGGDGIDKNTPNPPGGQIVRDGDGNPVGIFHEDSAIGLVLEAMEDNSVEQYIAGLQAYQAMANSYGITLNQDPQVSKNAIEAYEALASAEALTMRVRGGYLSAPVLNTTGDAFADIEDEVEGPVVRAQLDKLASDSAAKHTVGDLFQMNFVKIYGDGGGPTTFMKDKVYDKGKAPNVWPQEQLDYLSKQLMKKGVQIHCHSMGDAALASFLDAFAAAEEGPDAIDDVTKFRNSITHLQYVDQRSDSNDAAKMAALGVIGIPQPFWMVKDPYFTMYWPFCGKEKTEACYPMKSMINAGVIMAGGSDWPVTQPNAPLTSIQTGVTRTLPYDDPAIAYMPDMARNPMYRTPLGPSERVDLKTMIQSVTINGAYAMFLEKETGSIEAGKSADLVVLDKNLFDIPTADIGKTNVMMTLFKGDIVYQAMQPTVKDHAVAAFVPLFDGNPLDEPFFTVPFMIPAGALIAALNAPVDGSLEILDADDNPVTPEDPIMMDPDTGTPIMWIASTDRNGFVTKYPILWSLPPATPINFSVDDITTTGCSITFVTPHPGLTAADVYLLDGEKISAKIISVEDISEANSEEPGTTYRITASDISDIGWPYPLVDPDTSLPMQTLYGEHVLYIYFSDTVCDTASVTF